MHEQFYNWEDCWWARDYHEFCVICGRFVRDGCPGHSTEESDSPMNQKLDRAAFDAAYWLGQGVGNSDEVTDRDRDAFYEDYVKSSYFRISDYREATVFTGDGKEFSMILGSMAF